MANDLEKVKAKILVRALKIFRSQSVLPLLVNRNITEDGAQRGDTINVPVPNTLQATDVVPSHVPPANQDTGLTTVPVTLDQWKEVFFHLTDKDMGDIDASKTFLPMQVESAIEALARAVNGSIFEKYKQVYNWLGTPGVTPFATTETAIQARRIMSQKNIPTDKRVFVLDPVATANALTLPAFQDVDKAGKTSVKIEGELGRFFGFDFFEDNAAPVHTKGAAGTILVDQATSVFGLKGVHVDGVTALPVKGDVFTVAGDSQTYVVTGTSALDTGDADIYFEPKAKTAWADNAVLTFKADHQVNLALHRDAIAFAMRNLVSSTIDYKLGSEMMSMRDPETGLVMRLEITRQHKQTRWSVDMLWGSSLVRPEAALRVAG